MSIKDDINTLLVDTKSGNAYEADGVMELFSKMATEIEDMEEEARELDKELDRSGIPHANTYSTTNYRNIPKGVLKKPLFGSGYKKQEIMGYVKEMMKRMGDLVEEIQHKENLLKNSQKKR